MEFIELDWHVVVYNLGAMLVTYVLALPIAWNREKEERSAGLRTFPLVAVGVCGFSLLAIDVFHDQSSQARIIQGILAGIGFIGGGSILKSDNTVTGTATAASIWVVGGIGIAVAWQRLEIALLLSALTFFTLRYVGNWKEKLPSNED